MKSFRKPKRFYLIDVYRATGSRDVMDDGPYRTRERAQRKAAFYNTWSPSRRSYKVEVYEVKEP